MASERSTPFVPPWKRESWLRRLGLWAMRQRQWVLLLLLSLLALSLWRQVERHSRFPAHAVQQISTVGAPVAGTLLRVVVEKGSRVKKGEPIAQLDDRMKRMEWEIAKLEKKRLEGLLVSQALRFQLSQVALQVRLQSFVNEAQTSWASSLTRLRASRAELQALNKELRWLQRMRANKMGRSTRLGSLQARQRSLQALVAAMPGLMRLYRVKRRKARRLTRSLRKEKGPRGKAHVEKILRPLQIQWAIQTLRIKKLVHIRQQMTLRSPVDGVVQEVLQQSGASLLEGAPVARVVQDNRGLLLSYVKESMAREVTVGMQVQTSLRFPKQVGVSRWSKSLPVFCATVIGLGAMEPIPLRFRSLPQKPSWVRPVTIRLNRATSLIPGEMMYVAFSSGSCKKPAYKKKGLAVRKK